MSKSSSAKLLIVFDANIYIAAFLRSGLCEEILNKANEGIIELYISEPILSEVQNKLKTKLKASNEDIDKFSAHIQNIARTVKPSKKLNVIGRDPDDNKVIECAVEAKVNLIISLDKDLIDLKSYEDIGIVHPKALDWIIPKE